MSDQMNENEPKGLTRRGFLKAAAAKVAAATAAALGLHATASGLGVYLDWATKRQPDNLPKSDPESSIINIILANFSSEEKESAENSILKYKTLYVSSSAFEERVRRINKEYKPLIQKAFNEVALKSGASMNLVWLSVFPGLILAESSADPNPIDGSDIGLCQLTEDAIKDAKKNLHQEDEYIDPHIPENNIKLALAYLIFLSKTFPTADMNIWAYNLGSGNLTAAMEEYIVELYGEDRRADIENALEDPGRGPAAFLYQNSRVNVYKLLRSKKVSEKMNDLTKGEFEKEEVREYFYKVIGAARACLEVEKEIISQTRG